MKFFLLLLLLVIPALTCCGVLKPIKDAAVHHLLDPLVPERSLSAAMPSIAVKRPSIPSYLDRQQLVTRSDGQLMISSVDLWAEPLDAAVSRVISSNLSRITGSMTIQPVENFTTLDYSTLLEMRIVRFEPDDSNQMILEGTWKLQPVTGGEVRSHFFRMAVPISGISASMTHRVVAMNQALELLSRQIANSL